MQLPIVVLVVALASLAAAAPLSKPQLDVQIKQKIAGFPGKVSLYAQNLDTGESYGLDPDSPVRTASTIKLAIMVECFFEASEGKLDWSQQLRLPEDEKVSGTGILQDLTAGDMFPVRDLVDLMIVLSDNTATNLILNRIGGNAVNARMADLGLRQTRVMRKILGDRNDLKPYPTGITDEGAKPENKKWGIGRSSPHEMVVILARLYHGELVDREASAAMIDILKRQRDHDGIGRDMTDVTIASKSGALDHLRSDVGIIYSKRGNVAMAITVDDITQIAYTPDNPGDLLISALSEILLNGLTAQ
jgi:beta-lactamase class A